MVAGSFNIGGAQWRQVRDVESPANARSIRSRGCGRRSAPRFGWASGGGWEALWGWPWPPAMVPQCSFAEGAAADEAWGWVVHGLGRRGSLARARLNACCPPLCGCVQGRVKSLYSTFKKMARKGVPLSEVYDARALRVVVDDEDGRCVPGRWGGWQGVWGRVCVIISGGGSH